MTSGCGILPAEINVCLRRTKYVHPVTFECDLLYILIPLPFCIVVLPLLCYTVNVHKGEHVRFKVYYAASFL